MKKLSLFVTTVGFMLASTGVMAASYQIDTADPLNGLTNVYSATLDGNIGITRSPCTGTSPPDSANCGFWAGGELTTGVVLNIVPNPSGVANGTPGGITGAGMGSQLDVDLSAGNTMATLNGGTINFGIVDIVIPDTGMGATTVSTANAGFELTLGGSAVVDSNGVVQFLVDTGPDFAADFSTFTSVQTGCTGPLCVLVSILSLDMERYILTLDFNDDFTAFTGEFIGETANNSLVYATLNSAAAPIPVPAAIWLFGSAFGLLGVMRRRSA